MKFKCPHCEGVSGYAEGECKGFFLQCKTCRKEFRAAETSPLTLSKEKSKIGIGSSSEGFLHKRLKKRGLMANSKTANSEIESAHEISQGISFLNSKSAVLIERKQFDQAEKTIRESLQRNPNQPKVQRMLRKLTVLRGSV